MHPVYAYTVCLGQKFKTLSVLIVHEPLLIEWRLPLFDKPHLMYGGEAPVRFLHAQVSEAFRNYLYHTARTQLSRQSAGNSGINDQVPFFQGQNPAQRITGKRQPHSGNQKRDFDFSFLKLMLCGLYKGRLQVRTERSYLKWCCGNNKYIQSNDFLKLIVNARSRGEAKYFMVARRYIKPELVGNLVANS